MHQGRSPGGGLDCGGLVVCAAQEAGGVHIRDTDAYGTHPWPRRLLPFMRGTLRELEGGLEEARPATVVLFHLRRRPRLPFHMGILDEDGRVIHAWLNAGRVTRSPLGRWVPQVHSCYDYWPLEAVPELLRLGLIDP